MFISVAYLYSPLPCISVNKKSFAIIIATYTPQKKENKEIKRIVETFFFDCCNDRKNYHYKT